MKITKELVGTKFLLDKNIIKYHDLIQLLQDNEFNIAFSAKPIKDNLEVHSLYIKPDFEVSYLVKSEQADEYYKNAEYGCFDYKEVTLEEVLDVLGYKAPDKEKIPEKPKKIKKSKFLTLTNGCDEYTFIKKKINMFIYKDYKLEIILNNNNSYYFEMNKERYKEVKRELKHPDFI